MSKNARSKIALSLIVILTLLSMVAACSQLGFPTPEDPTVVAMADKLQVTFTARAVEDAGSEGLASAQQTATQQSRNIEATQTALVAGRDANSMGTATANAPIIAELSIYGLDGNSGHTGWQQGPLTVSMTKYHEIAYANDRMEVTAADFVLASDITWQTRGGSGCGFMFRSNGDKNKPSQYMVVISRFATGRALFTAVSEGDLANMYDIYPASFDKGFNDKDGATNRLAIVAIGSVIRIYTNNELIGEIDTTKPPKKPIVPAKPQQPLPGSVQSEIDAYQQELKDYNDMLNQNQINYTTAMNNFKTKPTDFKDGFLAMIGLNESGTTTCTFDNAWLWLLN